MKNKWVREKNEKLRTKEEFSGEGEKGGRKGEGGEVLKWSWAKRPKTMQWRRDTDKTISDSKGKRWEPLGGKRTMFGGDMEKNKGGGGGLHRYLTGEGTRTSHSRK